MLQCLKDLLRHFLDIDKLERVVEKADLANQNAIEFLISKSNITKKEILERYEYTQYKKIPWFIRCKLNDLLNIHSYGAYVYGNRGSCIGFVDNCVGELAHMVDYQNKVRKRDK